MDTNPLLRSATGAIADGDTAVEASRAGVDLCCAKPKGVRLSPPARMSPPANAMIATMATMPSAPSRGRRESCGVIRPIRCESCVETIHHGVVASFTRPDPMHLPATPRCETRGSDRTPHIALVTTAVPSVAVKHTERRAPPDARCSKANPAQLPTAPYFLSYSTIS